MTTTPAPAAGAPLRLDYAGLLYWDRTLALLTGEVAPEGVALDYVAVDRPAELFREQAQHARYAVSEMSLSTYLMLRDRADDRLAGLPVFPSRNFRHGQVYVAAGGGITRPKDLRGRRVGVPEYQITAALWVRGLLRDDHGVEPRDLHWFVGGLREPSFSERLAHAPPPGVRIERIPGDRWLEDMLATGDLDALVTVTPPPCLADGRCRRLFEDHVEVERAYHRRTGIFPIMHLVVCRRAELDAYPGLARRLFDAFEGAKARGRERLRYTSALAVSLPWLGPALEEVDATFGGDAFPYGIAANRAPLEAAVRYAHEQGLTARRLRVEELFSQELADT